MCIKPRVLLLNGTCFDVVDSHREFIDCLEIELITRPELRHASLDSLPANVTDVDALIGPTAQLVTADVLLRFHRLRVISLASSGFDAVDLDAATARGVIVANATVPEGAHVVADLAWGLMLAVSRQILRHDRQIRHGDLSRGMAVTPWRNTLGIVGLGAIGREVARRASGFDMTILAVEPNPDLDFVAEHSVKLVDLDYLLANSDFVSLHVRLNPSTRHMIAASQLARMKPTAYLINTARRELVDEPALAEALAGSVLAGAALDDPPLDLNSKMLSMDNVVFTTHIGNRARVGVDAQFRCALNNAADILAGRPCPFILNPEATRIGTRMSTQESTGRAAT